MHISSSGKFTIFSPTIWCRSGPGLGVDKIIHEQFIRNFQLTFVIRDFEDSKILNFKSTAHTETHTGLYHDAIYNETIRCSFFVFVHIRTYMPNNLINWWRFILIIGHCRFVETVLCILYVYPFMSPCSSLSVMQSGRLRRVDEIGQEFVDAWSSSSVTLV